jgi:murein DD-endopeptidase MepM/ murein hydrolase activator NlpD
MHNGIDYGASLGSPVVAARDGIVTKVVSGCLDFRQRWCGSQFGNWIEIDHGNGMVATYAHLLNGSITVKEGTKVWQNQEIAQVGSSGWSTGAHLDFRIKVNGEFENPAKYVKN